MHNLRVLGRNTVDVITYQERPVSTDIYQPLSLNTDINLELYLYIMKVLE